MDRLERIGWSLEELIHLPSALNLPILRYSFAAFLHFVSGLTMRNPLVVLHITGVGDQRVCLIEMAGDRTPLRRLRAEVAEVSRSAIRRRD